MSSSDEIRQFVEMQDLSLNDDYKIDGPWAFRDLNGLSTALYIFQKGTGMRTKIGEVVANTEKGLKFEIEVQEEYKDVVSRAAFEMPLRFSVKLKENEKGRLPEDHDLTPQALFDLAVDLKSRGYDEASVTYILRTSVPELRMLMHLETTKWREKAQAQVNELKEEGNTALEIAKTLGLNESTVRALLDGKVRDV